MPSAVLSHVRSRQVLAVLDSKYKKVQSPAAADISQIIAYAQVKRCPEAILVYPTRPHLAHDFHSGELRIRCLEFSIESDLEAAGQAFLRELRALGGEP